MSIYTKTGDKGDTSLLGGDRTSKADMRVWAYGTVDEANSTLGLARSLIREKEISDIILGIQKKLFVVAAELASVGTREYKKRIVEEDVSGLERLIDRFQEMKPEQKGFAVPGETCESSVLDMARTDIRRSERYIVELKKNFEINEDLMKYMNRLSDLIYVLARYLDFIKAKETVELRVRCMMKDKLDRELAEYIVGECIKRAEAVGMPPMVICVVDDAGNIIVMERMDGALLASIKIAQDKAYTSVALKMPTHELYDLARPDGELYGINNIAGLLTFGGGFPLKIGNIMVGGIGVSGGTVNEDMEIAKWGIKVFEEAVSHGTKK